MGHLITNNLIHGAFKNMGYLITNSLKHGACNSKQPERWGKHLLGEYSLKFGEFNYLQAETWCI